MTTAQTPTDLFDAHLRRYIYKVLIRDGRAPSVAEMSSDLRAPLRKIGSGLKRLAETHAFVLQENGELWRAAPFSAVPTAFPVHVGKASWYGNCIWDALGIPAMLHKDARIDASCGCCNYEMPLRVTNGKLLAPKGTIHFALPPRQWYNDIVFT
jgi:hypothetical protein